MRLKYILSFILLLPSFLLRAQTGDDSITSRILLIGDAGALVGQRSPVIDGARKTVPLDKRTSVIFLGDNLYRHGLPDEEFAQYNEYRSVLDSQVSLVRNTAAKAYFIPGNHDWENGGRGGYGAILRQQRYIDQISKDNVKFFPESGCPGPVEVPVGDNVVLVLMDSQWWIHQNEKPGIESDCAQKTEEQVLVELEDILTRNDKKLVVFACHHPFISNGVHGGYFKLKQHVFPFTDIRPYLYIPLPGLGSIYPISRSVFGTPQDLKHPIYNDMINRVKGVLKAHPHVVLVAGHEHTLQYFKDSTFNYVISGSGCKTQRVEQSRRSKFVSANLGFATLEVSKNKNVKLSFYISSPDSLGLAYQEDIMNFSKLPVIDDTLQSTQVIAEYRDSVYAPASLLYRKSSGFKNFVQGKNYRKEWSTPVLFREFNLLKEKGGFKIEGRGGGKQTKSLTLVDKNGKKWALRTIDKDPSLAIPAGLRGGAAQDLVQDLISTAHPYAPLVVPDLAIAAGVTQARPEFYFVPDDPAFGYYRKLFANKICLLETKEPVEEGIDTKSSLKIISNITEDNDHLIDQQAVLRARLLDMYIADWDRHLDQWKWAVTDTGIGKLYEPIAKDRDQAFFNSDGLLIKLASSRSVQFMRGFKSSIKKINWLAFSARDFDRIFLTGLGEKDWDTTARSFEQAMTDSLIDAAVKKLPREIYPISGEEIAQKLKDRRPQMHKAAMQYYRFLSKKVNVLGSNKQEYFDVTGTDTGMLVKVYAREKYGDTSLLVYSRMFDPKVTKEVRLYGFNDNDRFNIQGKGGIRVRMIGGRGIDTFAATGRTKNFVYDLSTEPNTILEGSRTKERLERSPEVNSFHVIDYQYPIKRFPRLNLGYNNVDGVMVGVGFWARTYGFRNVPYESDNKLSTLYAPASQAFNVRYRGEFNHVFRKYDFVFSADFYSPTLNNFYGLGNQTIRNKDLGELYYRTRYKYIAGDILLRKRLFGNGILGIGIGPSFYYYWNHYEDNKTRILKDYKNYSLDSSSIFGQKTYVGGKFNIHVNNLNNDLYPTRGIDWNNDLVYQYGLNDNSKPLTRFNSDMTVYASLSEPERLLAVLRLGGGHIFSKNYEYFQALSIGANNYLRGFRRNRFSGSSLAYGSIELRYTLLNVKSYLLPGKFGILGFDDVGRVWKEGENSKKWHNSYGGGVFFIPYNLVILSAAAGLSEEGTIFNFSLGTRLNLYF